MALGVDGVKVGCWTDEQRLTGCTVLLPPPGTLGAAAVRGGAPGTREIAALSSTGSVQECHGIVLSGGSAFGLATADGVAGWCRAGGIGIQVGAVRIPVVAGAIIMDLHSPETVPPGADAGRAAAERATEEDPAMGSVGVGAGCTVGKTAGMEHASKGGQGWAVARAAGVTVAALMAVNPVGEVIDERGAVLAGSRAPEGTPRFPRGGPSVGFDVPGDGDHGAGDHGAGDHGDGGARSNTVIGCLVTDADLSKPDACRAADLSHSGLARAVAPAHTSRDGDALFMLCTRARPATADLVADLGAEAVAAAIRAAVRHARAGGGFPADPRAAA